MIRLPISVVAPIIVFGGLAACSDPTGGNARAISLSFGAGPFPSASASLAPSLLLDVTSADGNLVISKAELVVREIELGRESGETEAGGDDNDGEHDGSCELARSDDDCEDLEVGPVLVDVPLTDNSIDKQITVSLPAGSYRRLEFKIQAPTRGNARDAAFRAAHPELASTSVHVAGTYRGTPFDLFLPANAEMEIELPQPLVVGSDPVNVTVRVDVLSWFAQGTGTIDPATVTPGSSAEATVLRNLKRSFHAFEDEDEDGDDDHGGNRG